MWMTRLTVLALLFTTAPAYAGVDAYITDRTGKRQLLKDVRVFCGSFANFAVPNRYVESLWITPANDSPFLIPLGDIATLEAVSSVEASALSPELRRIGVTVWPGLRLTAVNGKRWTILGNAPNFCANLEYSGPPLAELGTGRRPEGPLKVYFSMAFVEAPLKNENDPVLPPSDGRHFVNIETNFQRLEVVR